eukprot:8444422-Lingulodinium_polyedra.AAC.1
MRLEGREDPSWPPDRGSGDGGEKRRVGGGSSWRHRCNLAGVRDSRYTGSVPAGGPDGQCRWSYSEKLRSIRS